MVFHGSQVIVSSGLQDPSQYSDRFLRCYGLDELDSSFDLQLFQSPFKVFADCSKCANYNRYHRNPYILGKVLVLVSLFVFFYFPSLIHQDGKVDNSKVSFVNDRKLWFSGWDHVIYLYAKIPEYSGSV